MAKAAVIALLVLFCSTTFVESRGGESFNGQPQTLNFYKKSAPGDSKRTLLSLSKKLTDTQRLDGSIGNDRRSRSSDGIPMITEFPWEEARRLENGSQPLVQMDDAADDMEVQRVLDLLKKGEEIVKSELQQDVIIAMGNTGAGKTTFTQFITGNDKDLISVERIKDSDDFVIQDISGKISNTTWTSWTLFPELVVDKKNNAKIYDCPGFSDTRGVAHDITSTYFTREAIKNTQRIKLIFFVNYPSVRIGVDRQDFMLLAHHVTKAVKHIDKFKDSIALIVTKVDNKYVKGILVSDKVVIETVANFLREVKYELQTKISSTSESTTQDLETEIVKFIDILLMKDGDYYPRIGIFRRPDESGPISQISLLQANKKPLEKIVHVNTKYTKHAENDFDYTLSSKSKNSIHSIVETIKDNIASGVSSLVHEVEAHFSSREEHMNDVEKLRDQFQVAYHLFTMIKERAYRPQDLVQLVGENVRILNMSTSSENLSNLKRFDRYMTFLESFGARAIKPSEWNQDLASLIQHLEESQNWYGFLTELILVLSKYDVQRNKDDFVSFLESFVILMASGKYSEESHEKMKEQFQEKFGRNSEIEYDKVKYSGALSNVKLEKLKSVINFTLKAEVFTFCDEHRNDFMIKGQFVKLSDVSRELKKSCEGIKSVEILALEKVFIDDDLNLTGEEAQVSIISPAWEVVGIHSIVLDGSKGQDINGVKGTWDGSGKGMDGDPGRPGDPAGSFIGIGQKFVNGRNLIISVNGGSGGAGQDGTDGMQGTDGTTPSSSSDLNRPEVSSCVDLPNDGATLARIGAALLGVAFGAASIVHPLAAVPGAALIGGAITFKGTAYKKCTVLGKQCEDGSDGGNGGYGGLGGKPGQIEMISLGDDSLISLNAVEGKTGTNGFGGQGGRAGYPGQLVEFLAENTGNPWNMQETDSWDLTYCVPGAIGNSGQNSQGLQQPRDSSGLVNPSKPVQYFETFASENLNTTVRQSFLREFLFEKLLNVKLEKLS